MQVKRLIHLLTAVWISLVFLLACRPSNLVDGGILGPGIPVSLTIQVVDALTLQPISGARITLKKDGQNIAPDQASDGSGAAVFTNVPSGDGYKAFAGSVRGYTPAASPAIKLTQNDSVQIAMSPSVNSGAGLVAGSVKDASTQAPLAGVSVNLVPMAGLASYRAPTPRAGVQQMSVPRYPPYRIQQVPPVPGGSVVQTDASGQFTFNSVPGGAYQAVFQMPGYKQMTRDNIVVTPGESTTIETVFMKSGSGTGNSAGNILVVESGRVVQMNAQNQIIWRFATPNPSSATRLPDGNTLVADESASQVWSIGPDGSILWKMGSTLGLINTLSGPGWVSAAKDGLSFLITDTGNNRILEIQNGQIVWEFKQTLLRPRSATYIPNGNILIADTGSRRVIEVTRNGQVVWSFLTDMSAPVHAVRLEDGNTLITDAGYNRVIMINAAGQSVWYFDGSADPAGPLNRPRSAMASATGTFLISDTGNNRILEVNRQRQVVNALSNFAHPQVIERL
ncbi:hypothetical protein COW36_24555 [bacterium (Candidatus Blackallbacteria) CG17_big_fil_post_rev_8_21_14_2_50_48_46]|uniref:Pyrrolo-quinoline quinone repeat domain-containing protein n=1 Tax=bacterium (Candidatus Blackallbacteria) CG17_big_fil_post_rev_8_21_14_2_50_48_46 TaxID=2014261 RepID=A0A2M7FX81_9BACT|nr:MAG: hypothetical protein COW64_19495 [bacterium (Candidatus Blackallbacteria) CG18_big_fil_WC_8_21_14_2_50_49_26]PIW13841.1 MAG: hypothetical protein COW36_24555 [bacterium (Candidatus Blackallbacteria) CG17_big_fil_post_rev_8_21_14_2_50_48_46]PIW45067.1 MAG: hypothetical protein COW20_22185 [bacterium (Candidatus Blackallbacteria) CG13_big_fil_rev_8_21_14_2_50_49_14]